MKLFRLPPVVKKFLSQEHVTCWFSSRELLLSWEKKKKQISLTSDSGFSGGQIHDFERAVATLIRVLAEEGATVGDPLVLRTVTVFVSSVSSPLERDLVRRVFQKVGFLKVSLVSYATAVRSFAQRQSFKSGVGIYVGHDVSEGTIFSPEHQVTVPLHSSLIEHQHAIMQYVREHHSLEISPEAAFQLYETLGKKVDPGSHILRGRALQSQQVETKTLTAAQMQTLADFFRARLGRDLQPLTTSSLWSAVSPDSWVIVGDAFLNRCVQEIYQTETVFLRSEFDMIQGVTWLS